ncbi:hypothetical protein SC206_18985 [Rouxiella sp. T17]|uniref:hypothetical protein n=1 Tax=Rouxiella sp. T17 TaxID=3085684 RepID=UPI002FC96688
MKTSMKVFANLFKHVFITDYTIDMIEIELSNATKQHGQIIIDKDTDFEPYLNAFIETCKVKGLQTYVPQSINTDSFSIALSTSNDITFQANGQWYVYNTSFCPCCPHDEVIKVVCKTS